MKIRVLLIAFASAVVAAASATAQLRDGTFEVNGFAGYLVGGHLGDVPGFVSRSTPDGYRLDVGDDVNYGGRLGYNINSLFEVGGRVRPHPDQPPDRPVPLEPSDGQLRPTDDPVLHGLHDVQLRTGPERGYFTVGGGAADFSANFSDIGSRSKTYGTFAIGGGYKYFFSPHFALRFDAKFYDSAVGSRTFYCGYGYYCHGTSWCRELRSQRRPDHRVLVGHPARSRPGAPRGRRPRSRYARRSSEAARAATAARGHSMQTGAPSIEPGNPRTSSSRADSPSR